MEYETVTYNEQRLEVGYEVNKPHKDTEIKEVYFQGVDVIKILTDEQMDEIYQELNTKLFGKWL